MFYKVLSHLIIEIKTLRKSVEKEVLKYSKIVVKFYSEIFHRASLGAKCNIVFPATGISDYRIVFLSCGWYSWRLAGSLTNLPTGNRYHKSLNKCR